MPVSFLFSIVDNYYNYQVKVKESIIDSFCQYRNHAFQHVLTLLPTINWFLIVFISPSATHTKAFTVTPKR